MTRGAGRAGSKSQVRRAIAVVGAWDVLAHVEGPDLSTIATQVLSDFHHVHGVRRTFTAPVVPPDRVGIAGFGAPQAPRSSATPATYTSRPRRERPGGSRSGWVR